VEEDYRKDGIYSPTEILVAFSSFSSLLRHARLHVVGPPVNTGDENEENATRISVGL
jgi:hypothetical protein